MIPWWGWLVLWSLLVLATLVVFVVAAVSLFRKGIGVLTQFTELASTTIVFDGVQREMPPPRRFGVLMTQATARDAADARALRRATIKANRRDARLARGKALVSALYNPLQNQLHNQLHNPLHNPDDDTMTTAKLQPRRPTARRG